MKATITKYFLYFLLYGYIFLLFLKGYYPANETGILFIGFIIFMTLSYTFVGALLRDELDARRAEIYNRFEVLLDQQYQTLDLLRTVHKNIAKYKSESSKYVDIFISNFEKEIDKKAEKDLRDLINYETTSVASIALREQFNVVKSYTQSAYSLATAQLLKNRLKLKQ